MNYSIFLRYQAIRANNGVSYISDLDFTFYDSSFDVVQAFICNCPGFHRVIDFEFSFDCSFSEFVELQEFLIRFQTFLDGYYCL